MIERMPLISNEDFTKNANVVSVMAHHFPDVIWTGEEDQINHSVTVVVPQEYVDEVKEMLTSYIPWVKVIVNGGER